MRLGEQGAFVWEHPVAVLNVDHLSSQQEARKVPQGAFLALLLTVPTAQEVRLLSQLEPRLPVVEVYRCLPVAAVRPESAVIWL